MICFLLFWESRASYASSTSTCCRYLLSILCNRIVLSTSQQSFAERVDGDLLGTSVWCAPELESALACVRRRTPRGNGSTDAPVTNSDGRCVATAPAKTARCGTCRWVGHAWVWDNSTTTVVFWNDDFTKMQRPKI